MKSTCPYILTPILNNLQTPSFEKFGPSAKKFRVKYANHTLEQEKLHKHHLILKDGFMTP